MQLVWKIGIDVNAAATFLFHVTGAWQLVYGALLISKAEVDVHVSKPIQGGPKKPLSQVIIKSY